MQKVRDSMAEHIEVVIKIPKYYLKHPQDYSCLAECVRRGTPLPKGHWVTKECIFGVVFCSECDFELKINNTKYCPNCGAKMEVEDADSN